MSSKEKLTPQEQIINSLKAEIEDLKDKEKSLTSRIETQRIENSSLQTQLSRLQGKNFESSNAQRAKEIQQYKQHIETLVG